MRQILAVEYDQQMMLPPTIEEWIGPEHPARFIREFVGLQDLRALKLDTLDRHEGGVAYDPALLLQAWLYGYYRNIRSTRALEGACREEMGFVWLTGNHRPDHHALWRFWNEHQEGLRRLYRQSVKVAIELKLVGLVVQALDGTKIMAACSARGGFNREQLEQLLGRLEKQMAEREAQIAAAGSTPTVPVALHSLARWGEQVRAALQRVEAGEIKHAHPLEPDAARMECDGRNRFGYNAQAVVDAQAQIIVATDVTSAAHDTQQLVPMLQAAQANCAASAATPTTLADGGYANSTQLAAAEQWGYRVVTPPPNNWLDTSDPYHVAHFRHDAERHVVVCPQGRELLCKGVRQKHGQQVEVYRHGQACKDCPVRSQCTSDRQGRTIYIAPTHAAAVAAHARWQLASTAELYTLRAPTVEPVFAQIKQQMGFRRWTVRGLEKVRTQWDLLATTWNLRVLFRHWRDGTNKSPPAPRPIPPVSPLRRALSPRPLAAAFPRLSAQPLQAVPFFPTFSHS